MFDIIVHFNICFFLLYFERECVKRKKCCLAKVKFMIYVLIYDCEIILFKSGSIRK